MSRILILKVEGNAKIGILVDEVREVVTLTDDDIEQIATESGDTRTYLTGVGKYNESLISLLNIGALIADIDNE
jgi:purine-binding chemotaxis protein CheW